MTMMMKKSSFLLVYDQEGNLSRRQMTDGFFICKDTGGRRETKEQKQQNQEKEGKSKALTGTIYTQNHSVLSPPFKLSYFCFKVFFPPRPRTYNFLFQPGRLKGLRKKKADKTARPPPSSLYIILLSRRWLCAVRHLGQSLSTLLLDPAIAAS